MFRVLSITSGSRCLMRVSTKFGTPFFTITSLTHTGKYEPTNMRFSERTTSVQPALVLSRRRQTGPQSLDRVMSWEPTEPSRCPQLSEDHATPKFRIVPVASNKRPRMTNATTFAWPRETLLFARSIWKERQGAWIYSADLTAATASKSTVESQKMLRGGLRSEHTSRSFDTESDAVANAKATVSWLASDIESD